MQYMRNYKDKRFDPRLLVENARSVLVVALNYYPSIHIPENHPQFALYSYGQDYHIVLKEKLNELLHFLSAKKYSEMPDKQNRVLDYGALKINAEYRSVESNGELVQLTNYEFEILYLLAKNPGRIFSKEQIYTQVWKEPYYGAEDNVMGIIRRIRKKIEPDSAKPRYILNVWGMGYKFNGELMK